MPKFDEMCEIYRTHNEQYWKYENECREFARRLVQHIINYLGIPDDCRDFVPLDKQIDPNTRYTLAGAMHLNEDTWWHLGFRFKLRYAPNATHPVVWILVPILIKIQDGTKKVKLRDENRVFEIKGASSESSIFSEFAEHIFLLVRDDYTDALRRQINSVPDSKVFGFKQEAFQSPDIKCEE